MFSLLLIGKHVLVGPFAFSLFPQRYIKFACQDREIFSLSLILIINNDGVFSIL
jgi:hypothetical protein